MQDITQEDVDNSVRFSITEALKWLATAILIIGTGVNTALPNLFPLGPVILVVGGLIWLTVSILWKEWSLIVTNAVMTGVAMLGLAYHFLK